MGSTAIAHSAVSSSDGVKGFKSVYLVVVTVLLHILLKHKKSLYCDELFKPHE